MAKQKKNGRKKFQPRKKLSRLEKILLLTALINLLTAIINLASKIL